MPAPVKSIVRELSDWTREIMQNLRSTHAGKPGTTTTPGGWEIAHSSPAKRVQIAQQAEEEATAKAQQIIREAEVEAQAQRMKSGLQDEPLTEAQLDQVLAGPSSQAWETALEMRPYIRMAGGGGGALAGHQLTDPDPDDPWAQAKNALIGGLVGGAVVPGAITATAIGNLPADKLGNYLYYSYLSSPDTIARANLGAVGGVITSIFEDFGRGLIEFGTGATSKVTGEALYKSTMANAKNQWDAIPDGARIWWHTLTGDERTTRALRKSIFGQADPDTLARWDIKDQRFRDVGLGKWFSAGDNAAVHIMQQGGKTVDEAMRMTLAGRPVSIAGKKAVDTTSELLQSPDWMTRFAAASVAPFARVGIVGAEEGMKRMPLFGMLPRVRSMVSDPDVGRGMNPALMGLRQLEGSLAGLAGYWAPSLLDPRITQTLRTVTGPSFLPFHIGEELRRAREGSPEGWNDLAGILQTAGGQTVQEFNPLGFSPFSIFNRPLTEFPRRMIPAGMADVAELQDQAFGRETRRDILEQAGREGEAPSAYGAVPGIGTLLSQLPGLRQTLPERMTPVDWRGQPKYGDQLGAGMANLLEPLFPARTMIEPAPVDLRDPQLAQLARLGMDFTPPTADVSLPGTAGRLLGNLPVDAPTAAQIQRVRGRGAETGVAVLSQLAPYLERLPDPYRNRMFQLLKSRIERPFNAIELAASRALALNRGQQ